MGGSLMKARVKAERQEERSNPVRQFFANIRTWHLILLLIPLLFATATFLRFDHITMTELKQAVLDADAAGEIENPDGTITPSSLSQEEINANLETALKDLKDFVDTHTIINFTEKNGDNLLTFGTGPFYLEHQYNRQATAILKAAEEAINAASANGGMENANGNVFAAAMAVCKPQAIANGWAWNSPGYLNCMTGEINKYPTTDSLTSSMIADLPSTALYRFDFASPAWSPTLSGWSALLCMVLVVVIIVRLISWIFIRLALLIVR